MTAARHRYRIPIVRELPRRWDPLAGHEVFAVPAGAQMRRLRLPVVRDLPSQPAETARDLAW
jgi:hypothetical protein